MLGRVDQGAEPRPHEEEILGRYLDINGHLFLTYALQTRCDFWSSKARSADKEFYVNVTQKIKVPLSKSSAREVARNYTPWVQSLITPGTVVRASEIGEVWRLSFLG